MQKAALWSAAGLAAVIAVIAGFTISRSSPTIVLNGAVLRYDPDVKKQLPIADAQVSTADDAAPAVGTSDASGLFRLGLRPGIYPGSVVHLRFEHPEYEPLNVSAPVSPRIHVVRMKPLRPETAPPSGGPEVPITDVRVRYAMKTTTTVNVGSTAKIFTIVNTGNIPCDGRNPCSPDGKWRAAVSGTSLDAGDGNEFRNVRVSCIAGPCAFTRIEDDSFSRGGRVIQVSVRNWSDTATFLLEAEVAQTTLREMVRQSYPVIFGQSMNFTLPATGQGPSIEAEVEGADIVYPLGPNLTLSWADCSMKVVTDGAKLYRCALKPGYRFQ
jgi:hypothetical protein